MLDGEKTIIARAIKGEASAFGLLYDHYQAQIYRFVFMKVGHREEAEDLTHQVFLHAWQNIFSYKDYGFPFSSWLYRMARNQVIDSYRTRREHYRLDEMEENYDLVSQEIEKIAILNFELEEIREAILKLKPEYQDVIIMRFIEDLAPKEVALAIGKSEGAVKLIQHRAIKKLKDSLAANHETHFRTT